MTRAFFFIGPALLAGILGLVANRAEEAAQYLPRLRFMLLGAALLGYSGLALFVWFRAQGFRRWSSLLFGLMGVRIFYLPILHLAAILAGWLEWSARALGVASLSGPIHYALAVFVAALSTLFALVAVVALTHARDWRWALVLVFVVAFGVLSFWDPRDRVPSPHPFAANTSAPALYGPGFTDVARDKRMAVHKRLLALLGGLRDLVSPSSGWGGEIRSEMLTRFRGEPDACMGARVTMLEAALLRARAKLRISSRSPRGS